VTPFLRNVVVLQGFVAVFFSLFVRPHPPSMRAFYALVMHLSFQKAIIRIERSRITQEPRHMKRQSAIQAQGYETFLKQ
jgi:hypothetical protein